ncbi:MAG: Veg family protein [bacterium]
MNINGIKKIIEQNLGKSVQVVVYGMRNKIETYNGTLKQVYPNIFSLQTNNMEKTFQYADVCTGDIKIKYFN